MVSQAEHYSINDEGYFGISLLEIGSYAAHLMDNRVKLSQEQGIKLHFDEAKTYSHADRRALSIEGIAGPLSTPNLAIDALMGYVKIAREMDKLAKPLAS